jgi:hypothetical protein
LRIGTMSSSTPAKAVVIRLPSDRLPDQQLTLGNRAFAENHLNGIPVRVHRREAHVPNLPVGFGYRYDGLKRVASYWQKIGRFQIEKAPVSEDVVHTTQIEPASKDAPTGNDTPNSQRFYLPDLRLRPGDPGPGDHRQAIFVEGARKREGVLHMRLRGA